MEDIENLKRHKDTDKKQNEQKIENFIIQSKGKP